MSSFTSDQERQIQLQHLSTQTSSDPLRLLLTSERQRVQELTRQGIRKPKQLYLYVTSTITIGAEELADPVEKFVQGVLDWGRSLWNTFANTQALQRTIQYEQIFLRAFTDFQNWEQLLSTQMGLQIQSLTLEQLWILQWQQFNSTPTPPIPQKLIFNGQQIQEVKNIDLHPTTRLFEQVPLADKAWVSNNNTFIAICPLTEKPSGWLDKATQLRYLWEIILRDRIKDTEIICTLWRANESLIKTEMQRVQKQSVIAQELSATRGHTVDVANQVRSQRTAAAQARLYQGDVPLHLSLAFLVHRSDLDALTAACRYLANCVRRPALIERETEYAWKLWLQTFPLLTWQRLLTTPFQRQQTYLNSEVPGLMPLVQTQAVDHSGFELIADEGGDPIHLDLLNQHKNLALFATTRAGKSVLVSGILTQALAAGIEIVALDFPKPDGTSTFTDYTRFVGGAYFDIAKESNNLFELPDLRHLPPQAQEERMRDLIAFLESALLTMILGEKGTGKPLVDMAIQSVLPQALNCFFGDEQIMERYQAAIQQGFGSQSWQRTPTLRDFKTFCVPDKIPFAQAGVTGEIGEAFAVIKMKLDYWLDSSVGQAISAPSSFPTDAQLLVFALRNLTKEDDAAILSLSAYSAALRRALSSPKSIFFIDEAPILFEFNQISDLIARLCANGAKAGIRVIISGQDPDTLYKARSSAKIFQNLSTRLIGRIQPVAVDSFVQILKYPRSIIERNAGEAFFPQRSGIYSQWLLDNNGTFTFCRYYPAYIQLAAVANNPDEQEARNAYFAAYSDSYEALAKFAHALANSIRTGRPIQSPEIQRPETLSNSPVLATVAS